MLNIGNKFTALISRGSMIAADKLDVLSVELLNNIITEWRQNFDFDRGSSKHSVSQFCAPEDYRLLRGRFDRTGDSRPGSTKSPKPSIRRRAWLPTTLKGLKFHRTRPIPSFPRSFPPLRPPSRALSLFPLVEASPIGGEPVEKVDSRAGSSAQLVKSSLEVDSTPPNLLPRNPNSRSPKPTISDPASCNLFSLISFPPVLTVSINFIPALTVEFFSRTRHHGDFHFFLFFLFQM